MIEETVAALHQKKSSFILLIPFGELEEMLQMLKWLKKSINSNNVKTTRL